MGASSNPEPPEASSSASNSKKERKEIVMKVKQSAKVQEDKKWEVEDEEDDELLVNEAMESVKKAVDSPAGSSQKPAGKLDPKIASKILPGAKNFQDVEKWMEKQKKERMDQLKKKNNWKLVHQNSETTQDSELVFVNSIWKEHVEKAIIVIFVMNKNRRESRYLDECSSLSLMVKCQMDKKFLAF